jgi:hypothetical protein
LLINVAFVGLSDLCLHYRKTEVKQGSKTMEKPTTYRRLNDDTTRVVADITGYTERYVRAVRMGQYDNEDILTTSIEYQQGKSALIQYLKKLVPVTSNPKKYARKKD